MAQYIEVLIASTSSIIQHNDLFYIRTVQIVLSYNFVSIARTH